MPAGVHLLGSAAYQRKLRADRRALGLCRLCSQRAVDGRRTCAHHLAYLIRWKSDRRSGLGGLMTTSGARIPRVEGKPQTADAPER